MEKTNEYKIEVLEIQKEDTEKELILIEQTIQQVEKMKDNLPKSDAREELNLFVQKLAKNKEINEDILQEINDGLEHIRGY